jgi:hypothetical protein
LGRVHAVRLLFGSVILVLCVVIFYQNFYKASESLTGVIRVPAEAIQETWMTLDEFVQLAKANTTCPVSFALLLITHMKLLKTLSNVLTKAPNVKNRFLSRNI